MMISLTGLHCPFDIGFVPGEEGRGRGRGRGRRRGDVLLVSRMFWRAKGHLAAQRHTALSNSMSSRSQLCLPPRKLIFCRAKQLDSASNGPPVNEEHGSIPVDVIENFPERPVVVPVPATPQRGSYDALRLRAKVRVSEPGPSGNLPPHILYLLELGFDHEEIDMITRKFPKFAYYTLEGKIRPLIEFLLDLGVSKSNLPKVLIRCPALCGMRLSENIIPTMTFLETFGVDRSKWVKLISRYPSMLTYSRTKIEATVEFLYEVGLSGQSIGKILTRWPEILGCSVEENLRPSAEYFQSLGVDVAAVLRSCPSVIGLSIEDNLKHVTEFFLEKGFTIEEVGTMISRFACLYAYSLKGNMVPKWEFFLTMDYTRQDLIKYPQYFGYSLKARIKPRYSLMIESGLKFSLSQLLHGNDKKFELLLKKRIDEL